VCTAVLVNGVALLLLSLTGSLLHFYLLFLLARMNWAGPFDLGIYGALSNWFVRRRHFRDPRSRPGQQAGLVAMPLIARSRCCRGWRAGWLAIGAVTLLDAVCAGVASWAPAEDLGSRPTAGVTMTSAARR